MRPGWLAMFHNVTLDRLNARRFDLHFNAEPANKTYLYYKESSH